MDYFDLNRDLKRELAPQDSDHTTIHWIPQWLTLLAGIVVQPFFSHFQASGNWDFAGFRSWILFSVIVAFLIFPAVYRGAFDAKRPIIVQLGPIFTRGHRLAITLCNSYESIEHWVLIFSLRQVLAESMTEQAVGVTVVKLPDPKSRSVRTLREVILKDKKYRRNWINGRCRKIRLRKQAALPAIGTTVKVPLRPDSTNKISRLREYVHATPTRSYFIYLPEQHIAHDFAADTAIERWQQRFENATAEIFRMLSGLAEIVVIESTEIIGDRDGLLASHKLIARPLRSLNMLAVDVPLELTEGFEERLSHLEIQITTVAPIDLPHSKPTETNPAEFELGAQVLNKPEHSRNGAGTIIGILDTGINPKDPEFLGKQIAFAKFDELGFLVSDRARYIIEPRHKRRYFGSGHQIRYCSKSRPSCGRSSSR